MTRKPAAERADDWAREIESLRAMRVQLRRQAIASRDGWLRRIRLRVARWLDYWIEVGRRWRDDDLAG